MTEREERAKEWLNRNYGIALEIQAIQRRLERMNADLEKVTRPLKIKEACLDTEYCKCSYCGTVVMLEESVRFHFCPNCGADMRKEGESN